MAIGYYDLIFLSIVNKIQPFKKTATIGRQQIATKAADICKILKTKNIYKDTDFSENLFLNEFGSNLVHSYDASDYEGCSHIADFSQKRGKNVETYDTIIEFGSMEHIFNISTFIENIQNMTKKNGIIIHTNPANNFCGHGFYQFSPEFFYSIYSEQNGFANTKVFLVNYDSYKSKYFYKVIKPNNGNRVDFKSKDCLGNLVYTKKIKNIKKKIFYQSDYLFSWGNKTIIQKKRVESDKAKIAAVSLKIEKKRSKVRWFLTNSLKNIPPLFNLINYLNYRRHLIFVSTSRSYKQHPSIVKVSIDKLKILN